MDALERPARAVLITIHTRATRPLLSEDGEAPVPALTPEQLTRIKELQEIAASKHKAAEALIAAGLEVEAEPFHKAAEEAEAAAHAIASNSEV